MTEIDTNGNWLRLHRKIVQSRVFQNEGLLKVWIWCLCRANFRDNWVQVKTGRGETEVLVRRGQFVFGRKEASKILLMPRGSVYDRMRKLERMGNLIIQPSTHYSIVTVCNYDTYNPECDCVQQATQQASNTQPTPNQHPTNTDKNDKNVKKEKNKKDTRTPSAADVSFEAWWELWPARRKKDRKDARSAYDRAVEYLRKDRGWCASKARDHLHDRLSEFATTPKCLGKYCPYPATWLNRGSFDDDPQSWQDESHGTSTAQRSPARVRSGEYRNIESETNTDEPEPAAEDGPQDRSLF